MPVAGASFVCAFILAMFAWLMQLGTFWLPILTGDVRYGHGICIKLDTNHSASASVFSSLSSKTAYTTSSTAQSQTHAGHHNHHASHDVHTQQMVHEMSTHQAESHASHHHHEYHMMSTSTHDHASTLIGMIQASSANHDIDDSNKKHCDICMLLASVSSLDVFDDFRFHVIREAQAIATHWLYRQRLETTFDYILPPSRAPPVFS